jgi:hypothetical protein
MSQPLPPCAIAPEMYQDDDLLNPPSRRDVSAAEWRAIQAKRERAHHRCAGCPVLADCLYRAVVEIDVSGFVACTAEADRRRMRRELGIDASLAPAQSYGASRVGGGPVDHESVLAARRAHPDDTCRELAERLGCSTSTIKRHLRQERQTSSEPKPTPALRKPTLEDVLDVFDLLDSSRSA